MDLFKIGHFWIFVLVVLHLCSCVRDPIILNGDIRGTVLDIDSSEPLDSVNVSASQADVIIATSLTENTGEYHLEDLVPGEYTVAAVKSAYESATGYAIVEPASTFERNFELTGVPFPAFSEQYLDFGVESTVLKFALSNAGSGTLDYTLIPSQDWITVNPREGEIDKNSDTITVTIEKSGLSYWKHEEVISVSYHQGQNLKEENLDVLVNGVRDQDGNYYAAVIIGSQIWMAESLNTGEMRSWNTISETLNDFKIEKYCHSNLKTNCDTYGGMYAWDEMMNYHPGEWDTPEIVQGICPDGWHLPDFAEWDSLIVFAGGTAFAGGNLKDTSTVASGGLWLEPNDGATNMYGFTALPGGGPTSEGLQGIGEAVQFWSAQGKNYYVAFWYNKTSVDRGPEPLATQNPVAYVRCIKDL